MALFKNNKLHPWFHHGGELELDTLMKQVLDIKITFPHTAVSGGYTCRPVTINLGRELGVSSYSSVYAVNWENSDKTTTVKDSMSSYKHEHTFNNPGTVTDFTKTFRITLYGDPLLPVHNHVYQSGSGDNAFKVETTVVESPFNKMSDHLFDDSIRKGARITRAYHGGYLVYGKKFAGSEYKVQIKLTGNTNTVRLVNPLLEQYCTNWNNRKNDIRVNWGDGHEDFIVNRKINTGIHNTDSNIKVEHQYLKGKAGDIFNLTITSVEPVLPIGCEVIKLNGSLPEDIYTRKINDESNYGFLKYTSSEINKYSFRHELTKHRSTIVDIGDSLLDNWLEVENMDYMFYEWTKLGDVKKGLFKDNIIKNVKSYKSTFEDTHNLKTVDPLLIGSTNDIITNIDSMFSGSVVTNTLDLVNAPNLKNADYIYRGTKVTSANNFLHNAPKVTTAKGTFFNSTIQTISDKFLSNSVLLEDIVCIFENTEMNDIKFNFHNYPKLYNLGRSYFNSKIPKLRADLFGGNFAKDVADNKINMSEMFANIKLSSGLIIDPLAFTSLGNKSNKICDDGLIGLLNETIVRNIPADMLKGVLKSDTPRFRVDNMLNGVSSTDVITQTGLRGNTFKGIYLPSIFKECNGIVSAIQMLSNMTIGDIDDNFIADMVNLQDIRSIMYRSTIMFKRLSEIFNKNIYITTWTNAFDSIKVTDVYNDYPMNRFINTKADRINITGLFKNADTKISVYRMFTKDASITAVNDDEFSIKNLRPSVPDTVIYGNIKHNVTFNPTIKPIIFTIVVTADSADVSFVQYEEADDDMEIKYELYGNYITVSARHMKNFTRGVHHISVKCRNSVKLYGDGFDVIRISGEYPYNSKLDFEYCRHYRLREIDRYVFAVCDHTDLHKEPWFEQFIPILHKDIFEFHDDVTKTNFFSKNNLSTGIYGIQPFMLDKMYKLNDLDNIFTSDVRVLTKYHIPKNITLINKTPKITGNTTGRLHIVGDIKNGVMTDFTTGTTQIVRTKGQEIAGTRARTEYLEMRLSAFAGQIKLSQLVDDTIFPITVEVFSINGSEPSRAIINDFNTAINIDGESLVRIYSSKAVWIDKKDKITELFGNIPTVNLTKTFLELAPNLRRIGEDLLINITNTSVRALFKGLKLFEYFPGTLFWNLPNVVDYYECFAECPKLTKVDDYIITAKIGNKINCGRMFANSGVRNVRHPIMSDIIGKVNIDDMLLGCDAYSDIDAEIFTNIDFIGSSKVRKTNINEPINYPFIFVELNSDNVEGLKNSYYIPETTLRNITDSNALVWASQSIPEQVLYVDRTKFNPDSVKYLPFIHRELSINRGNVTRGYYDYMERLTNVGELGNISGGMFNRTNNIKDMDRCYQNLTLNNVDICHLFPSDCGSLICCSDMMENTKGIVIRNGWKIPKNIIVDFLQMMKDTDVNIPVGMFDNREIDFIPDHSVCITEIFIGNKANTTEVGIFKAYGNKLRTDITSVYSNNTNLVNMDTNVLDTCTDLESVAYFFNNCNKLKVLPKINHLSKCYDYSHFMDRTAVESVPENYIYTTRTDMDIVINYMFADCKSMLLQNTFIDARSKGKFYISHSLNNVLTTVGDDTKIFGHINYDTTYERRSRAILFDSTRSWMQNIKINKANTKVSLTSLQQPNLIGYTTKNTLSIIWGDGTNPTNIGPGTSLTDALISHTFNSEGEYQVRIMCTEITIYIETLGTDIQTTGLPTSFKYGTIEEVKTKGLNNMFGETVVSINEELFYKLKNVNTVTMYKNMLTGFRNLSTIPAKLLDCFTSLQNIDGFLYNTAKDGVSLELPSEIFSKLPLNSAIDLCYKSNVFRIGNVFTNKHIGITNITRILSESKVTEIPRTLLSPLTNLQNASQMLCNTKSFMLDGTYVDMLKTNIGLQNIDYSFSGVKINELSPNMLKNNVNIISTIGTFSAKYPLLETPDSSTVSDSKNWIVPTGFLQYNAKLQNGRGMFSGRISCTDYPNDLLHYNKSTLNNTNQMFANTGITDIKRGTLDGKSIPVDARYMFWNCSVNNCPSPITNSSGTIMTTGMLQGAVGELTEVQLFSGVKTEPTSINSGYKQGFRWFIMDIDVTDTEEVYVKALENSFPWNGFVVEVQYNDKLITELKGIPNQDTLTNVTKVTLTGGKHTVKVRAPFAVELKTVSGRDIKYSKLYGSFGKMLNATHIPFNSTGFGKVSNIIIDDGDFYVYNKHITNIDNLFVGVKLSAVGNDVFRHLINVTTAVNSFKNIPTFRTYDKYQPNFNFMTKLNNITNMFESTAGFVTNETYQPFSSLTSIKYASRAFYGTGIVYVPKFSKNNVVDIHSMCENTANLTSIYSNDLDNMGNCSNSSRAFYNTPKLTNIIGETSNSSLMSNGSCNLTNYNFSEMFRGSGLSYNSIVRIVNNMFVFKSNNNITLDCNNMFRNVNTSNNTNKTERLKLVSSNKTLNATEMFSNTRMNNIGKGAITLTGNSSLKWGYMFWNCFASPDVESLNQVFNISGTNENTDFRNSELDTLNVFTIKLS